MTGVSLLGKSGGQAVFRYVDALCLLPLTMYPKTHRDMSQQEKSPLWIQSPEESSRVWSNDSRVSVHVPYYTQLKHTHTHTLSGLEFDSKHLLGFVTDQGWSRRMKKCCISKTIVSWLQFAFLISPSLSLSVCVCVCVINLSSSRRRPNVLWTTRSGWLNLAPQVILISVGIDGREDTDPDNSRDRR